MKELIPNDKPTDSFAVAAAPDGPLMLREAFEQLGIETFQLSRISLPAGGATAWTVPTLEGDEMMKELEVIIAAVKGNEKVFWREDFSGAGSPPDCLSHDGMTGFGIIDADPKPGTAPQVNQCSTCPHNQWGSATGNGGGKRCNDIAILYIFRKDTMMPDVITVPPSSLKSMREYAMKLMQSGLRMTDVATKLILEQAQSASGIKYSKLAMKYARKLSDEERSRMSEVSEILTKSASSVAVSAADLNS
jgi:hypothetical protein